MSILSINGVTLPVAIDSLHVTNELVGNTKRNTRGHRILERRRDKWVIEFALPPKPLDEAMMYRSLLLGDGEFWSMGSGAYGSKGLQINGTGAWSDSSGGNPITAEGVWHADNSETMIVPVNLYNQSAVSASAMSGRTGGTLVGWRHSGGAYRIFGFSWRFNEAAPTVKREKLGSLGSSGAAQAYTGTETIAVSSSNLTITEPASGGPYLWSNMMLLPWCLPQAQVDALMAGLAAVYSVLPDMPRVYVMSDLLPTLTQLAASPGLLQTSLICHGDIEDFKVTPVAYSGSFDTTECVLSGTLTEV